MDLASCFILTVQSMRESSSLASKRATAESSTRTETSTTASGQTIELTDTAFSKTPQEHDTKGSGKQTNSMVGERKYLRKKARFMRATFMKARNTAKVYSNGPMEATTKAILCKANTKDAAYTTLLTKAVNTKGSSLTTKCMAWAKKHGQTVENTKETTETPKRTGLAPSYGPTATCTKGIGETTNRTGRGFTST